MQIYYIHFIFLLINPNKATVCLKVLLILTVQDHYMAKQKICSGQHEYKFIIKVFINSFIY